MTNNSSTSNETQKLIAKLINSPGVREVNVKPVYSNSHPFTKVFQMNDLYSKSEQLDLIELMDELSSGARKLFIQAKNNYNYKTGTSYLPTTNLTRGQINKRGMYVKELKEYDLLKKVPCTGIKNLDGVEYKHKANTFMISPHYIIPRYEDISQKLFHLWSQL